MSGRLRLPDLAQDSPGMASLFFFFKAYSSLIPNTRLPVYKQDDSTVYWRSLNQNSFRTKGKFKRRHGSRRIKITKTKPKTNKQSLSVQKQCLNIYKCVIHNCPTDVTSEVDKRPVAQGGFSLRKDQPFNQGGRV